MPELKHFDVTDDKTKVYAAIQQDGACVVENFISLIFCDVLMKDFGGSLQEMDWGTSELGDAGDSYSEDSFYGYQTKRLHGPFSKSEAMVDVLLNAYLLKLADHFLLRDKRAREIRLSNASGWSSMAGKPINRFIPMLHLGTVFNPKKDAITLAREF